MSTEPEDEGADIELYEPMPVSLSEDDCHIFDPTEFSELFNALAVQFKAGDLWVLDRDTLHWLKVEPRKSDKPTQLKRVQ